MGVHTKTIVGRTQAAGAFVVSLDAAQADGYFTHQIQVEVSAPPSAGALNLEIRNTAASAFEPVDGSIDLVGGPRIHIFHAFIGALRITPVGFDADKTFTVHLMSGGDS